jgi:hypothetical protein
MGERQLKIVFIALALLMLAAMIVISRDAGISGDEKVHYNHSEQVYNYFKTMGADQSALHTPNTHLQYYGQAFDNIVTILIHWFNIEDIYGFRHLACSVAGWLTIVVTGLFAAYLAGYGAAILVLLLFAVSPTFLGHAQNNLKDIPFALAYIASVYYSLKIVFSESKLTKRDYFFLVLSFALAVGIRAGGFLVIFYFGFFFILKEVLDFIKTRLFDWKTLSTKIIYAALSVFAGYLLGLVLWPYALQNPIVNSWKSYVVMTHFPTTVRQIFEGNFEWSDFLPWYYLPKYMAITIPIAIFLGVAMFLFNSKKSQTFNQKVQLAMIGFTILFPVVFVLLKHSNLYGSWRHFLFIYPALVLIAALGIHAIFLRYKKPLIRYALLGFFLILCINPLRFMAANHPYYYLYYNEFVGGLKGAYGKYETDYYYHSMRKGAEWLQEYLKENPAGDTVVVGGNFPIQWYFRKDKQITFVYFPWQQRSEYNWDYAIVANSYIPPYQLTNNIWPPQNAIHTVMADGVPVCAVIKRVTKDDLEAVKQQKEGNNIKSALLFENAIKFDSQNELICYKFAEASLENNREDEAIAMLNKSLQINPGFEKALVLLGDLAKKKSETEKAAEFYAKAIKANRKYYAAYPKLAGLFVETDVLKVRRILKNCLKISGSYKPALVALADTYRKTDPQRAKHLDEMILKMK